MKDQFYLHFDTMPTTTSQEKGVYVRGGKPYFYEKDKAKQTRLLFVSALKPHRPAMPSDRPIKLKIWFAFDVKDKKKWGKVKPSKPDTDNFVKLFKDCMTDCGFWNDDSQVVDERIFKTYSEKATIMVYWEEMFDNSDSYFRKEISND